MEKPLVSVITPMYNGEKYLGEMIDSVIGQTYDKWELVIVDDCSTDGSCKIVEEYIKRDNRIRLIKQKKNTGPAEARRVSIKNAKGKYIAFLDCDDIWMPEKLEKQIRYMESKDIAVTCTSYQIASEDLKQVYKNFIVPEKIDYKILLKQNYFSCDTVIINKEKFKGIRIKSYAKHEDYLTWLGIMKQCKEAYGIKECLAIYRVRRNSRSTGNVDNVVKMWEILFLEEKLGAVRSSYYTIGYIIRGLVKYRGVKNK